MSGDVATQFPAQPSSGPPQPVEFAEVTSPDPHDSVNEAHVRNLAATRQTAQIERRAENARYHDGMAKRVFRQYIAAVQSIVKKVDWQLSQLRPRMTQTKQKKSHEERFSDADKGKKDQKQPATRWILGLFVAVLLVLLIAIANGTVTVSSVMLDSTAFAGAVLKTITVALGFFVTAPLAIAVPFHLLKSRPRLANYYLFALVGAGMMFYFIFALTWALTYGQETGNQVLIDLASIGMGGGDETASEPWLLKNSNVIALLTQILADVCFAGAAKCYLWHLTWHYALFRRKAFQQDPQWLLLDQEERELARQIAELEGQKKMALERLEQLAEQQDEFVTSVCSLADALFLREVDTYERKLEQKDRIEQEVREKEQEWRRSRHLLDEFVIDNPGS